MTREEEIQKAAKIFYASSDDYTVYKKGFEAGAKWADQHPIDIKIKEMLLAYTIWLDKRGFFKEDLQCDFPHQIETFLEMKGGENGND